MASPINIAEKITKATAIKAYFDISFNSVIIVFSPPVIQHSV